MSALEGYAEEAKDTPVNRPELNGKWRLLYTSRPGRCVHMQCLRPAATRTMQPHFTASSGHMQVYTSSRPAREEGTSPLSI